MKKNNKTEAVAFRMTKRERAQLDKVIDLYKENNQEKSITEVLVAAMELYISEHLRTPNEYDLNTWKLTDRKTVRFKYGNNLDIAISDIDLVIKDIEKMAKEKYSNDKSKRTISRVAVFALENFEAKEKYDKQIMIKEKAELEALRAYKKIEEAKKHLKKRIKESLDE